MENNTNTQAVYPSNKFRFIDGLVLLVFISTAFLGLYLFRQDLMRTFEIRDVDPAGIITLRNNVVQRRHADRVLWDRIFVNSFVYPGDLVRVAEISSANVDIAANDLFLNENTLIRIEGAMDSSGSFRVELQQGNLSVRSGADSNGILLNLFGNQIQTRAGTQLDVEANEEGISLQVNEGNVEFKPEGQDKAIEITEGSALAFDSKGRELFLPSVSVRKPVQNARYLNEDPQEMYLVKFEWSRLNIDEAEPLQLEIARDVDYKEIISVIEGLDNEAQAGFDIGQWYWRLVNDSTVLRKGWFNIIDSSGPSLLSPIPNTAFRYQNDLPQLRFQWEKREWASSYIIEVSEEPDFMNPFVKKQINTNSFITSELGQGTWHWRVKPVFTSAFIGAASFSYEESFNVEQTNDPKASAVLIPSDAIRKARAAITGIVRSSRNPSVSVTSVKPEEPVNPVRPVRPARGQEYTIRPGDTLGRIAREHYGDPMLWSIIVEANDIRNPDLIYPGQVFIIP